MIGGFACFWACLFSGMLFSVDLHVGLHVLRNVYASNRRWRAVSPQEGVGEVLLLGCTCSWQYRGVSSSSFLQTHRISARNRRT